MSGTNLIELLVALFGLIPPIREAFTGTALRESLTNEPKKLLKLASKFRSNDQKYAKTLRLRAKATEEWTINCLDIWLSFRLPATLVSMIPVLQVICFLGFGGFAIGQYSDPLITASCLMEFTKSCLICLIIPVLLPYLAIALFNLQRKHSINRIISQLR